MSHPALGPGSLDSSLERMAGSADTRLAVAEKRVRGGVSLAAGGYDGISGQSIGQPEMRTEVLQKGQMRASDRQGSNGDNLELSCHVEERTK